MTDDGILLLLDGFGDGLHLIRSFSCEGMYKQRVLQGYLRVKVGLQKVLFNVKLPSELQIHWDLSVVNGIEGLSHLLIIVNLRYRASPVNDHGLMIFIGHRGGADIVGLIFGFLRETDIDTGKVGPWQKSVDL